MATQLVRECITSLDLTNWLEMTVGTLIIYFLLRWMIRRLEGEIWKAGNLKTGRQIPRVSGGLPIIGHGLKVLRDPAQFFSDCYKIYGDIFIIQIFKRTVVILCNRNIAKSFLRRTEEDFSFQDALRDLNFDWPFYEEKITVASTLPVFRKVLALRLYSDRIMPKIEAEAKRAVMELMEKCMDGNESCRVSLNEFSQQIIARTTSAAFIGKELNNQVLIKLRDFSQTMGALVSSTFFLPNTLSKLLYSWKLGRHRREFVAHFLDDVRRHRDDESLVDSILIRIAADHVTDAGVKLTDTQVGEFILNFMFAGSENTAVGVTNAITHLMLPKNAAILERVREECKNCLLDTDAILNSPLMNAVVLETARLSSHISSIHRVPQRKDLGDYLIPKDVETVILSPHMLMAHESAADIYHDPLIFNPDRFLGNSPELKSPPGIMTWGGGIHACPGKGIALCEIKIILAHLFSNFDLVIHGELPKFNYFRALGFANREVEMIVRKR